VPASECYGHGDHRHGAGRRGQYGNADQRLGLSTIIFFVASFVVQGDLYGVSDANEIWRWDTDEAKWVKVGEIDRDG
jgi:hypothetical protein